MNPQLRRILAHHKSRLSGSLRILPFRSRALGITKDILVYEPPGLRRLRKELHLLYLFRGHEREWANLTEDESREQTSVELLDELITQGDIPPVMAVMPGLTSNDGKKHGLGINMMGSAGEPREGLGSGLFWDFMIDDLIPYIEARYQNKMEGGLRLASGFSIGGYTTALLATAFPGYLDHAGIYDGLLMFDSQIDRRSGKPDEIWMQSRVMDPALGPAEERVAGELSVWNPAELLYYADPVSIEEMHDTMFWIRSAAGDGQQGNIDRCAYFKNLLHQRGLPAGFTRVPLHPEAAHTWHWNDRFLKLFLLNVFLG